MARPRAKKVLRQRCDNSPSSPSPPPLVHPRSESWEFPPLSQDGTPVLNRNQVPESDSLHVSADTDSIPAVFKAKNKLRSSHIWLPENGKEVLVKGISRWQCQRCKWLPLSCHYVPPLTNVVVSRPESINRRHLQCHGNYQKCGYGHTLYLNNNQTDTTHCCSNTLCLLLYSNHPQGRPTIISPQ